MEAPDTVHLVRTEENVAEVDGLAERYGGRVGLAGVLADLDRRARRTCAPGLAVRRALTWERGDRRDPRWWPQGISTSADASTDGRVLGRRLVAVTWYAREVVGHGGHGSRVTFLDLGSRRYRHVLLVRPTGSGAGPGFEPLRVHAGGLVWHGPHLHVAATARGFVTLRVDDLLRVSDEPAAEGHRYVLPVRFAYRATTPAGQQPLRYSFLSLDRATTPAQLVVGEYGGDRQTRRLARFAVDADSMLPAQDQTSAVRPLGVEEDGVVRAQGAVRIGDDYYVTASHGPWLPGSVYVGRPGAFRRHRWATPMGPEDLAYWPETDELWTVTEHPRRRWIVAMRRRRLR